MEKKLCLCCYKEVKGEKYLYCSRNCYFKKKKDKFEKNRVKEENAITIVEPLEIDQKKEETSSFIKDTLKSIGVGLLVSIILLASLFINIGLCLILTACFSFYFIYKLSSEFC